ncbi:hypothetical protein HDU93_002382 [Gonapodya sp. JEL0774]|nr:hypothetical protein HDU93_002382 [Gonapodya sp. JEL0774]
MDTLPIETLQRIFRILPPSVFYGIIPRVSRWFRDACLDAIPGCPGGTVGIICSVTIDSNAYGTSAIGVNGTKYSPDAFVSIEADGPIWTTLRTSVRFPVEMVAGMDPQELGSFILESIHLHSVGGQRLFYNSHLGAGQKLFYTSPPTNIIHRLILVQKELPDTARLKLAVDEMTFRGRSSRDDGVLTALETSMRFVTMAHVRTIGWDDFPTSLLDRIPENMIVNSVKELILLKASGATWIEMGLPLLKRFPFVQSLQGAGFVPRSSELDRAACGTPDENSYGRSVTSLTVNPFDIEFEPAALLSVVLTYPNLRNLKEVKIQGYLPYEDFPKGLTRQSLRDVKLLLTISLLETISTSSADTIKFVRFLTELMPALVNLELVSPANTNLTILTTVGELFGLFFDAVAPECIVTVSIACGRRVLASIKNVLDQGACRTWPEALRDWNLMTKAKVRDGIMIAG